MIFVPISALAAVLLIYALIRFVRLRDMSHLTHRLFAGLIAAYAAQSVLVTLRWGYGLIAVGPLAGFFAPVLPVLAWLSYQSLRGGHRKSLPWTGAMLIAYWGMFLTLRDFADLGIILIYLGIGGALIWQAYRGSDDLVLTPFGDSPKILRMMRVTGGALMASGVMDLFVIYDFIMHDGQHIGAVSSLVQTGFVMLIGLASTLGRAVDTDHPDTSSPPTNNESTQADHAIITLIEQMFQSHNLHRDEDLSLRKLSRRLAVPERAVSGAINRTRGVNVSQFVNEFRIQDACHLLQNTTDSILDISLTVGFATKSNFNREFVRVTGKSPSEWRKTQAQPSPDQP